jgi:hypothetical protein
MRVIRRTAPSRVGYGASVGRRRLLHTYVEETAETVEQTTLTDPDFDTMIHLKVDAPREAANLIRWQRGEARSSQTLIATVSRARGQ